MQPEELFLSQFRWNTRHTSWAIDPLMLYLNSSNKHLPVTHPGQSSTQPWNGLWTWPPWLICAPAFNHKIRNAAHSGVSEVVSFTKSYKWKKQRWKNWTTILKIPNGAPIQDGWATDPITTEIIPSRYSLKMIYLFSVISMQQFLRWKFRNMFTE